jgi:hypothetical protein
VRAHVPGVAVALAFVLLLAAGRIAAEAYLSGFGRPEIGADPVSRGASIAEGLRAAAFFLVVLLLPAIAVAAGASLVLGVWNRTLPLRTLAWTAAAALALAVLVGAEHLASHVRAAGFARSAERMAPLTDAVARFAAARGHPPSTLDEISPTYLQSVDRFGVRGCRPLSYVVRRGVWELRMECPNGWSTLDIFSYHSDGRRPRGRSHESMGAWVYFWD